MLEVRSVIMGKGGRRGVFADSAQLSIDEVLVSPH